MSKSNEALPNFIVKGTLIYPYLSETEKFKGKEDTGKYSASLLISKKSKKNIKILEDAIQAARNSVKFKISRDKTFVKDGEDLDGEVYEGMLKIKASNKQKPALLIANPKSKIKPTDTARINKHFYAGAQVSLLLGIWIQDNEWGKRLNCNLNGVMFHEHGEKLPMGGISDQYDSDEALKQFGYDPDDFEEAEDDDETFDIDDDEDDED